MPAQCVWAMVPRGGCRETRPSSCPHRDAVVYPAGFGMGSLPSKSAEPLLSTNPRILGVGSLARQTLLGVEVWDLAGTSVRGGHVKFCAAGRGTQALEADGKLTLGLRLCPQIASYLDTAGRVSVRGAACGCWPAKPGLRNPDAQVGALNLGGFGLRVAVVAGGPQPPFSRVARPAQQQGNAPGVRAPGPSRPTSAMREWGEPKPSQRRSSLLSVGAAPSRHAAIHSHQSRYSRS